MKAFVNLMARFGAPPGREDETMRPLRAFLFSFAAGFAALLAGQMAITQLTYVPAEPPLQGPLPVSVVA